MNVRQVHVHFVGVTTFITLWKVHNLYSTSSKVLTVETKMFDHT